MSWNRLVRGTLVLVVAFAIFPGSAMASTSPMIREAAYTNAVASELKSLQWTHFYATFDRPVWAVLTIHDGTGKEVRRIFDGPVPEANKRFWFPSWNGKDPNGRMLPSSAGYTWKLRAVRGGVTAETTGRITVCKVVFTLSGTLKNPEANMPNKASAMQGWDRYLVAGPANVYVYASSREGAESFGLHMPGEVNPYRNPEPNVFRERIAPGGQLAGTYYLRSPKWDIQRGLQNMWIHSWEAPSVTYQITVLQ